MTMVFSGILGKLFASAFMNNSKHIVQNVLAKLDIKVVIEPGLRRGLPSLGN